MSTGPAREYEFTQEQNRLIGALAGRMRGVGLFLVILAVLNLLFTVLVVAVIYRAKLPQDYVDKVVKTVGDLAHRTDVQKELANLPPDKHLWGIAIFCAVNFLIYLLVGVWTREAAGSFRKIVDTQGNDISHLMSALSALNRMYTLILTLILLGLLSFLAAAGYFAYAQFTR
jgi:hypothetical protein